MRPLQSFSSATSNVVTSGGIKCIRKRTKNGQMNALAPVQLTWLFALGIQFIERVLRVITNQILCFEFMDIATLREVAYIFSFEQSEISSSELMIKK